MNFIKDLRRADMVHRRTLPDFRIYSQNSPLEPSILEMPFHRAFSYPDATEFTALRITTAAITKKHLAGTSTSRRIFLKFATVTGAQTSIGLPARRRHDCRIIARSFANVPHMVYRGRQITFKRKSKQRVRLARQIFMQLQNLKSSYAHVTHHVRAISTHSNISMQMLASTFKLPYLLNIIRLPDSVGGKGFPTTLQHQSIYSRLLPVSRFIYYDIITALDAGDLQQQTPRRLRKNMHRYMLHLASMHDRNKYFLPQPNIFNQFDVPTHLEIDYTALCYISLLKELTPITAGYGTTQYTYGNFLHLYNGKIYF